MLEKCQVGCACKRHSVSEKSIEKIRASRLGKKASPEARKNMSNSHKGQIPWNIGLTKDTDIRLAKISNDLLGHSVSDVTIKKILKNSGKKRFSYVSETNIILKMRSNWEVSYAKYLDSLKVIWQYEPKIFKLSNDVRYLPDFYLPESNEYHEVKGLLSIIAKKKIDLFRKEYPDIKLKIIDSSELQKLGILRSRKLQY